MILVVFEVKLAAGQREHYLALAAALRAELAQIDGFISIERFQSLNDPDTLLSLSCFRDEAAVQAWRSQAAHREGQAQGRATVFADYRLRVAAVLRDYGLHDRVQAPADSRQALEAPLAGGAQLAQPSHGCRTQSALRHAPHPP